MHYTADIVRSVAALVRYLGWIYERVRQKAGERARPLYPFISLSADGSGGGDPGLVPDRGTQEGSQDYRQPPAHYDPLANSANDDRDIAGEVIGSADDNDQLGVSGRRPDGEDEDPEEEEEEGAAARVFKLRNTHPGRAQLHPVTRPAANVDRRHRCTMGCCGKKKLLMIMTSVCACASFAFLCIAVATDYWLYALERVQDPNGSTIVLSTYTGLWRKCRQDMRLDPGYHCSYINYFTSVERDGLGPTESILVSMRRSTLFPLISLLILIIGEIMCFVGHCNHKKKVLTFVAGILFVVGGLCTLIGIIIYIGAITEEVGNKPKNTMDEPRFQYHYGSSFILTISSFVVSELTGVLSVYLYISRHKHAYRKKQERLTMIDTNERQPHNRYRRSRSHERSREHSRDNSPSHSDTFYTYTPVSDTSKEMSNYTLQRDPSRHTISTSADTHLSKDHSIHSVRDLDTFRRTTPV